MRIHFPVLSMLSSAVLIGALIFGAKVNVYDLHLSVASTEEGISVSLHPTFLCLVERDTINCAALTYGNLIICRSNIPDDFYAATITHEARHLDHWRALGIWTWAAQYILPLEPPDPEMSSLRAELATMWRVPESWPWHWTFLTIRL